MARPGSIRHRLGRRFPQAARHVRFLRKVLRLLPRLYGFEPRQCTVCGHHGKFMAEIHFPDVFTYDAVCPRCGALPRQRLLIHAIKRDGLLRPTDRLLHFAPERCIYLALHDTVASYLAVDLNPAHVHMVQDIEALSLADASFDAVLCSHVLEHVDHHRALAEIFRVLAPGGRLLAQIPIVEGWAQDYENPAITSPRDRALHFGRWDHRRRFGREVRSAFTAAGFTLEDVTADGADCVAYGLIPGEAVFVARKPIG